MKPQMLPPQDGIGTLITRVIDDGKAFVAAEITLYRAHATRWTATIKFAAAFGIVAIILANAAIIALLVGLILTLQPLVGPGWATLIVVVATLVIAGILGWLVASRVQATLGKAKG